MQSKYFIFLKITEYKFKSDVKISKIKNSFKLANMPVTRLLYEQTVVTENRSESLARSLDEKRKLYRCRDDFVTLTQVLKWPEYFENVKFDVKKSNNGENKFIN